LRFARAFGHEPLRKLKGIDGLFNGRHFDSEGVILCVRWYLRYKLSFRDLAEMIRGKWAYFYRAVDRAGKTLNFRLSAKHDVASAKAFFVNAIRIQARAPATVNLDGYAASHLAVRELKSDESLPRRTKLRSSKYLNSRIEQDHRHIKTRGERDARVQTRPQRSRFHLWHRTDDRIRKG
jgi:transposase-like protein